MDFYIKNIFGKFEFGSFGINFKFLILFVFLVLFSLFFINMGFAGYCGGNITCNCSDTINQNYNFSSNLNCNSSSLTIESGVVDCNNYNFTGNLLNNGFQIFGRNNVVIKNCNFKNFKNAIFVSDRYVNKGNGWGSNWQEEVFSNNIKIFNNSFYNNFNGINLYKSKSDLIFDNNFKNNSNYGLYLGSKSSLIYNNSFYNRGIYQVDTAGKSFCKNNISNLYFDNATGSKCDCVYPNSNLQINSKVNICYGDYYNIFNLNLRTGAVLNCNYSNFFATKSKNAISVKGSYSTIVKNCNFYNYSTGINYIFESRANNYGRYNYRSYNNKILNSSFNNLNYAIFVNNYLNSRVEYIYNSSFNNNLYNIYNRNNKYKIFAQNNYWGDNNESIFKEKFLYSNYVDYFKYQLRNISQDYYIKNISVDKLNGYDYLFNLKFDFYKLSPFFENKSILLKLILIDNFKVKGSYYYDISDFNGSKKALDLVLNLQNYTDFKILINPNNNLDEVNYSNNFYDSNFNLNYIKKSNQYENSKNISISNNSKFYNINRRKVIFIDLNSTDLVKNLVYKKYLNDFLNSSYDFTDNISKADILILFNNGYDNNYNLGLNNGFNFNKGILNKNYEFNYYKNIENKNPYEGFILSKNIKSNVGNRNINNINNSINNISSLKYVLFNTNDVSSEIALLKYFVLNSDLFLTSNYEFRVNKTNIDAIRIYDFLSNYNYKINFNNTNFNNSFYESSLNYALYDNMYKRINYSINISFNLSDNKNNNSNLSQIINSSYNLIKFESLNSKKYQNFVNSDKLPIVFAGGLFSNIYTFKKLATNIASRGYNTYLIEITGNSNNENLTSYNYNYSDLINVVYPEFINFILKNENVSSIKYVGHSNGARVGLDFLSSHLSNQSIIDTFVGIGVPGSFQKNTPLSLFLKLEGSYFVNFFSSKNHNKSHISIFDLMASLDESKLSLSKYILYYLSKSSDKISLNLFKQYVDWINLDDDLEPGVNISINNFYLIYGDFYGVGDFVVPTRDELEIFNNIKSNNKDMYGFLNMHSGMSSSHKIMAKVDEVLNIK